MHNVCSEYTSQVIASIKLCSLAEKELQLIREVSALLPGDFNVAASTLYGGSYYGLCVEGGETFFDPEDPNAENKKIMGMTVAEAEQVFKTGVAFAGTYEHFQLVMAKPCYVVSEEFRAMEVCEIIFPNLEMREKLAAAKDEFGHTNGAIPLGILKVKHWTNPEAAEEDMSDYSEEEEEEEEEEVGTTNDVGSITNEVEAFITSETEDSATDSFWLEEHILEKCFIGMRLRATVFELNIGLKYINSIVGIECSFYTYLTTERLDGWKEPIFSSRPGPTVDDPDKNAEDADVHDFNKRLPIRDLVGSA
jgi:hypothetical protein